MVQPENAPSPEPDFSRYIPGLMVPPPDELVILNSGGVDYRQIITPEEATERLEKMGYSKELYLELFARRMLGHKERALILTAMGEIPRVESILASNIRVLDMLQKGPIDPTNLSLSEMAVIRPIINHDSSQTEAVKQALAESQTSL